MHKQITKKQALNRALLTVGEFASLSGLAKITVYRHVEKGAIPTVSVGRRRLIPNSYYSQFFNEGGKK